MGIASLHPSYETRFRLLATLIARGLHLGLPSRTLRAQGRPGARCTRGLACNLRIRTRTRAYRFSGNTPAFTRRAGQVLTDLPVVLICRSFAPRLCLRAKQISSQSVGWAKRLVRRSSTSEGGSVPTIMSVMLDGGHGANAPLPAVRTDLPVGLFGRKPPHETTNLRITAASVCICAANQRTIERLCREP